MPVAAKDQGLLRRGSFFGRARPLPWGRPVELLPVHGDAAQMGLVCRQKAML